MAVALWSSGDLAIRERRGFPRTFDLAERVIPAELRERPVAKPEALRTLLLLALAGHGWATRTTLRATWRLGAASAGTALGRLEAEGQVVRCDLVANGRRRPGFIRPEDLELAHRLDALRPRVDGAVLLSPFDPLLWDRARVRELFGFDQVLEIFKPAPRRVYGYYCLPVLAGARLVARVDLAADRRRSTLEVRAVHIEDDGRGAPLGDGKVATGVALRRYAEALALRLVDAPGAWRMP